MIAPDTPSGEELLALRCEIDHYEQATEKIAALASDITEAQRARERDYAAWLAGFPAPDVYVRPDLDEALLPGLTEALRFLTGEK